MPLSRIGVGVLIDKKEEARPQEWYQGCTLTTFDLLGILRKCNNLGPPLLRLVMI